MADLFSTNLAGLDTPYENAALVTPDDATDLSQVTRAVFVGGAGNMKVTTKGGQTLLLTGLAAGQVYRLRLTRIWSTTTTATNIAALW